MSIDHHVHVENLTKHDATPPSRIDGLAPAEAYRELRKQDARVKETWWDRTWMTVEDMYCDRAAPHIRRYLQHMKLGMPEDVNPTVVSLVRYITAQLAVTYRSPATRRFRGKSERGAASRAMLEVYDDAGMDSFLREADRRRVRDNQCFIRFYPSDHSQRVKPVLYSPRHVMRWNVSAEPDDMRTDEAFGIHTGFGVEFWRREGPDRAWHMTVVAPDSGEQLPDSEQPFAATGYRSPYASLPFVAFFEGIPDEPFIAPRASWEAYSLRLSVWHNEISEQIRSSAHRERMFEQLLESIEPVALADMPRDFGPGMSHLLPQGVQAKVIEMSPVIADTMASMRETIELWLKQENLPVDSFRQSQSVSALGLRTLAQPLRERQESQRDFAIANERRVYQAFAAVHNVHAASWGAPPLDTSLQLDVELGAIDVPVDENEAVDSISKRLALRMLSPIDALQRDHQISRREALSMYERVAQDFENYPVSVDDVASAKSNIDAVQQDDAAPGEDVESTAPDAPGTTAPVDGADKAQDTALNGAQVTAAQGIVESVAGRLLPRDTGIAMLVSFFNIPQDKAEGLMGSVGRTFFADVPNPTVATPEQQAGPSESDDPSEEIADESDA